MTDVTTPTPGWPLEGTVGDGASPGVFPRCQAVVLACIDFRFVEPLRSFLGSQGLTGDYDLVCWPGGALALTTPDRPALLDALALACDFDRPSELILVVHHDCDRVGGSASFPGRQAETATLDTALTMAAESATERFPQLRVRLARLDLDGPCAVVDRRSNPIALLATVMLAPIAAGLLQMALSRNREFEADRAGADLIGDGEPLARALLKLEQGAKAIPMAVQPAQASKYIVNPLSGRRVHFARLFTTHPPTEQRVARLRQPVTGARR